jgi:hypothetical protein
VLKLTLDQNMEGTIEGNSKAMAVEHGDGNTSGSASTIPGTAPKDQFTPAEDFASNFSSLTLGVDKTSAPTADNMGQHQSTSITAGAKSDLIGTGVAMSGMENTASTLTPASVVMPSVTTSSAITPSVAISKDAEQQQQAKEPPRIPPILNDRMDVLTGMIANTSDQGEPRAFTCFQSLPCELRLQIWRHVLRRRRTIHIYWCGHKRNTRPILPESGFSALAYTDVNSLGNKTSGQRYYVKAGIRGCCESTRFPSALMAVNAEARQAALDFYYIQVPAVDSPKYGAGNPTIYINPEFDHIRFTSPRATDHLDFFWDMAAYDPKGKGIESWIVCPVTIKRLIAHGSDGFSGTSTPGRFILPVSNPLSGCKKMCAIFANLKTIMITHHVMDRSRLGLRRPRLFARQRKHYPHQPLFFSRSYDFDVLAADPRPGVNLSLTTLWVFDNPKVAYDNLVTLLGFFNIKPADVAKLDITHMIFAEAEWNQYRAGAYKEHDDLVDLLRADAVAELKAREIAEDANDDLVSEPDSELDFTPQGSAQPFENHDANASVAEHRASNEKLGLPPLVIPEPPPVERVTGFWLFPPEAFEDVMETQEVIGGPGDCNTRWNVSGTIPQLGVFRLPAKSSAR